MTNSQAPFRQGFLGGELFPAMSVTIITKKDLVHFPDEVLISALKDYRQVLATASYLATPKVRRAIKRQIFFFGSGASSARGEGQGLITAQFTAGYFAVPRPSRDPHSFGGCWQACRL
jgi:hypothetical protein